MKLIINLLQVWMAWSLIGHAALHAVLSIFNNNEDV